MATATRPLLDRGLVITINGYSYPTWIPDPSARARRGDPIEVYFYKKDTPLPAPDPLDYKAKCSWKAGEEQCTCHNWNWEHKDNGTRCKHLAALHDLGILASTEPASRAPRDLGEPTPPDPSAKAAYAEACDFYLPFGKHKGKTIGLVGETDWGLRYLAWLRNAEDLAGDLSHAVHAYLSYPTVAIRLLRALATDPGKKP